MATERRHMQLERSQPLRTRQHSTAQRSNRASIPRVLRVVLPYLALAVVACGGGEDGDEPTDSGDPGPPTADEIRSGSSPGDLPPEGSDDGTAGPDDASTAIGDPTAADASVSSESRASASRTSASGASTSGASASAPAPSTGASASSSTDAGGPPYAVQLGAFERESNAQQLRQSLEDAGFPVRTGETGTSGGTLLRVRVGATTTVADARRLVDAIRARLPEAPDSVWIAPLGTEGEASEEMMTATRAILDDG